MNQSDFYFMDDPVARYDANMLTGQDVMSVMQYLKNRLSMLTYRSYGKYDTFQSPSEMFSRGDYDCEDGVGYVATVFKMLGIPHTVNIGTVEGIHGYHAWITLPINGKTWLFETTAPDYLPMKDADVKYIPIWSWRG